MTETLTDPGLDARYEATARDEMEAWKRHVLRGPGVWDRATRGVQDRINRRSRKRSMRWSPRRSNR